MLGGDKTTSAFYLRAVFKDAPPAALRAGFIFLGRLALHEPNSGRLWLTQMLSEDLEHCAAPALEAVLALGQQTAHAPLGLLLTKALEDKGDLNAETVQELERGLPEYTVSLRELALWVFEARLRYVTAVDASPNAKALADLRIHYGIRLSELGRREEALEATQQAVESYRELAKERPDAFLPYLAMSLNNLGSDLSELGKREEALEAARESTKLYTALTKTIPQAFAPSLMISLETLNHCLRENDQDPEDDPTFVKASSLLKTQGDDP